MRNKYKEAFNGVKPSQECIDELKENLSELQKSNKKWIGKANELQRDIGSAWKGLLVFVVLILIVFGVYIYTNKDNPSIHYYRTHEVIYKILSTDDKDHLRFLMNSDQDVEYDFVYNHQWSNSVTEEVFSDIVHNFSQYQLNAYRSGKEIKIQSYQEIGHDDWVEVVVLVQVDKKSTEMRFKTKEQNEKVMVFELLDDGNLNELIE